MGVFHFFKIVQMLPNRATSHILALDLRTSKQYEEKSVHRIIFITSRHGDKNITQLIRIISMPTMDISRCEAYELGTLHFFYFQNNPRSKNSEGKYMLKVSDGDNVVKYRAINKNILLFTLFWCFYC